MSPAGCVSTRHSERDCLTRWSVSGGRFPVARWCEPCQASGASQERLDELRSPEWRRKFARGA